MEKFLSLPAEKRKRIIDASLQVFGENTYRKASAGDIAAAAGISKGMIFHYFGSKRALYLYLISLCGDILTAERQGQIDMTATDFFDRIKLATVIKIAAMKKHPYILAFLKNVYIETDSEVVDEVREKISYGVSNAWEALLAGIDITKFKNPSAPALLAKLLTWAGEGVMESWFDDSDIDERLNDYIACLDLMRESFYEGGC
jgi:AcrR family transcriptional regulator